MIKAILAVLCSATCAMAAAQTVSLPAAQKTGGMPVNEALAARHAERSFAQTPLKAEHLSQLLWAAWGINRADGRRTIPTALNRQEMKLLVNLPDGLWRYEAQGEKIEKVAARLSARFSDSPAVLVFVVPKTDRLGRVHAGLSAQSAGLVCASLSLLTRRLKS